MKINNIQIKPVYRTYTEEQKYSERHKEYLKSIYDRHMVKKYYEIILKKSIKFDQNKYIRYHNAYNKIANVESEFVIALTKLMQLPINPDEKWDKYCEFMNQAIEKWNKEHSAHTNKLIEEIK